MAISEQDKQVWAMLTILASVVILAALVYKMITTPTIDELYEQEPQKIEQQKTQQMR